MAIASVTWSPLLRPAYRACSGAAAVVDGATAAVDADADADAAGAAVLPGLATRVLAHRKITARTTTQASVIKGPRLLIPGYRLSVTVRPASPAGPPGAAAGETRVAVGASSQIAPVPRVLAVAAGSSGLITGCSLAQYLRCGRYGLAAGAETRRAAID